MKYGKRKINQRDLLLGIIIGLLIAIILSSLLNAYIFKRIIQENRAQSNMIQMLLDRN